MFIIAAFTLSVGIFFSYLAEEYARYNEYAKMKSNVTSLAASFDPNQVASLSGSAFDEGTQSFDILHNQLRRIKISSPRYKFAYLMGRSGDDIYFVAGGETIGSEGYTAPGASYTQASPALRNIFVDGVGFIEGPLSDEWGTWVSAIAAIRNQDGDVIAVLGIDQSAEEWLAAIAKTRYAGFLITLLLSAISSLIYIILRQTRRTNAVLRESASNVQAFLTSIPDALIIVNDKGEIVQTNDEIDNVFGYKSENIIRKTLKDLLTPEDYERLILLWTEYFERGALDVDFSTLEFTGIKKNGDTFPVSLRLSRFTSNGKTYSCGIFRDISERKAREQRVAGIHEEADAANRAKSEYIAGMSHELRTPLNVIIGYSELMQKHPDYMTEEKRAEYLEHVVKSGRHMLDLVGQVLDIAKIESGDVGVELSTVQLLPLAQECLNMIRPLGDAADLKFSLASHTPAEPDVLANQVQLKQVLLNILSNSVKYNEPGGSVDVAIEAIADDFVKLSISDTGSGISPEMIGKIFLPFNRLGKSTGDPEGHGIGLSIAKSLIEGMGGVIGFVNNTEKGSTFWIELPLYGKGEVAQTHQDG
jgi:PAS domain S-box-containing protein